MGAPRPLSTPRFGACASVMLAGVMLACLLLPAAAGAEPVATVRGPHGTFSIDADRLQTYLAEHPERTRRQGLQDLIDFELLAAEARAAGLAAHPDVAAAGDRAMAAAWLRGTFEPTWTAERLPEAMVRESYEKNRAFFDHPQLRRGAHILVTGPGDKRPEGALDDAARALAEQIRTALLADPPQSADAFRVAGAAFGEQAETQGLAIKAQSLGTFSRRGRFADEFEDAAFAIESVGVPSAPFPSRFGWHIVRLDEIIPEKRQSFEEAEDELRARIVPEVRRLQFLQLGDRLAQGLPPLREAPGVRGLVDPIPLDAVAVRRGLLVPQRPVAGEGPPAER